MQRYAHDEHLTQRAARSEPREKFNRRQDAAQKQRRQARRLKQTLRRSFSERT